MIEFQNVHKSFGDKQVLNGMSLEIAEGETMVIIGQSGSGKSVSLKHIVGLLEPDQGAVEVDGMVVHQLDRSDLSELRSQVGFVFQFAALFDSMTVRENLSLGLERKRLPDNQIAERVRESLALVDLDGSEDKYPAQLSGGMRKRVGIARAIALKPKYILYDEPTSGLDPVTAAMMNELMIRTNDKTGATGVVVTHDMDSAYQVGDRIAMLHKGKIRQVGTVDEIKRTHDPIVRQFIEGRPEAFSEEENSEVTA